MRLSSFKGRFANANCWPEVSIACLTAIYATLSVLFPWKHNPDGNIYYLVALHLLNGDLLASVDGVFSPLLSWLLVIPTACGLPFPAAYRLLGVFIFLSILISVRSIAVHAGLSSRMSSVVLLLSALQCCFLSLRFVMADLLVAMLMLRIVTLLCDELTSSRQHATWIYAFLGALVYYAKAVQVIILFVALFLCFLTVLRKISANRWTRMRVVKILAGIVLLCMPWVTALSFKYDQLVFSAQTLIYFRQLPLEYSPYNMPVDIEQSQKISASNSNTTTFNLSIRAASWLRQIEIASRALFSDSARTIFAELPLCFFLSVLCLTMLVKRGFVRGSPALHLVSLFSLVQILIYMLIWGGRVRYFLPILPLLNVIFLFGLLACVSWLNKAGKLTKQFSLLSLTRAFQLVCAIFFLGILQHSVNVFLWDWNSTSNIAIYQAQKIPELAEGKGAIAGFELEDQYPALIAYGLKRPFWLYLSLHINKPNGMLREKLIRERVSQIIVPQQRNAKLESLEGVQYQGTFQLHDYSFALYDFKT